ncbi:MAG TPA: SulP family inorganic anion transporter [Nitrospiraceae bacterium]|nr:SulP family inorganic anion transporter [Nitrospiraceae bacterium]
MGSMFFDSRKFVFRPADIKHDVLASIVVFLVALPLCMGIAIASGQPPGSGIMTGIIGGLVVGLLAGCPFQVSGPAAGLTVVVWELMQTHGREHLGLIILLAGTIQLAAAWLQLGHWFRAVSPAVIHGMLAGIGILIFAGQFHVMIDDVPKGSGLANLMTLPDAMWKSLLTDNDQATSHHEAARIGLLTIGIILLWTKFAPPRLRLIPAVLVGVVCAAALTAFRQLPISHVSVRDDLFWVITLPSMSELSHVFDTSIWGEALGLAVIASVETLLAATAVDQLHTGPRTRYNRELFAQGVGNTLCGLLCVLPVTGVIVRSAANVQAGAKTRMAAVYHGLWLLLFVSFLPFILRLIPTASLGAVLVYTGYKLMNVEAVRELRAYGRSEVWIYLCTLTAVVTTNLLIGVLIGVGLAVAKLLYQTQTLESGYSHDLRTGRLILELRGIATFLSLPRLARTLEQAPPLADIRVKADDLRHIDHACLNLLESWHKLHEGTGGKAHIPWDHLRSLQQHTAELRQQEPDQPVPQSLAG